MLHYIQNNLASEEIESRVSELTEGSGDPEVEKNERKKRKKDINRDVKSAKTATYRVVSVAMHDVLQCYWKNESVFFHFTKNKPTKKKKESENPYWFFLSSSDVSDWQNLLPETFDNTM